MQTALGMARSSRTQPPAPEVEAGRMGRISPLGKTCDIFQILRAGSASGGLEARRKTAT